MPVSRQPALCITAMTFPSIVSRLAAVETKQLASCAGVVSGNTAGVRVDRCPVTTVVSRMSGRITGGRAARFDLGDFRDKLLHCRRKGINHFD